MHVHSFVPFLGLAFIPFIAAAPQNVKRDLQVSNTLPAKWSYVGCYTDSTSARGLQLDGYAADDMTEGKCIGYCDQGGYSYAGVEYGRECRCDNYIHSPSNQTAESECNFPCAGASDEPCGGSNRMNVFTNGVAPPMENPGVNGYHSLGCYTDSQTARTLSTYLPVSDGIVFVRGCTEMCQQRGFSYCGVEYGKECYGGSAILNGGQQADPASCDMRCTGNSTEKCGGSNRINLYQVDGTATTSSSSLTTTSSTTSSLTTNSASSSSTSSPTSTCAGLSGNSGLLQNGGFENGISPWVTKNNLGSTSSSVVNGVSYAGCYAFQMQTSPSSSTSQFQFSQSLSSPLVSGQKYTLTFYQGRRSASASDGDSSDPVIAVSTQSQRLLQGYACSASQCGIQGANGSVYQKVQVTFTASSGQSTISWVITYTNPGTPAPVLFDEISLATAQSLDYGRIKGRVFTA